ncbi:hypothetical protein, partial [Bacteroides uniformis]
IFVRSEDRDFNYEPIFDCLRTLEQKASLLALLRELKRVFPHALIVGHHDLNPQKDCPCFDAEKEYRGL